MLKLAYNTTDSAIVVDEAGYSIGGHEWGPVNTTDPIGSVELREGRLVVVDEKAAAKSENVAASGAVKSLEHRRDREARARKMDKDELAEAVAPEVLETMEAGSDGLPSKDDLVDAVVADPLAVPESAPKKSTSRTAAKK